MDMKVKSGGGHGTSQWRGGECPMSGNEGSNEGEAKERSRTDGQQELPCGKRA